MSIAVIGATGTAGSHTVAQLNTTDHDVVPLSRSKGIDLHTGEGLVEALQGVSVVIDTSNPIPSDPDADVAETMASATQRLVDASTEAGVEHLVLLSICNIHSPAFDEFPYYLGKRAQEHVIAQTSLSTTLVCSTQWYEFATNPSAVTFHDDRIEAQDWLIQPIAVETVASVLVESAIQRPERRQIAGPEHIRLPDLTRAYLRSQDDTRPIDSVAPSLPALADGILLAPDDAERLGPTLNGWLEHQAS